MTIVYGILCLGFLVFFHELGHFTASHIFGVTVESFSIGMGPVLLHHKWGKTDYRLSLIPLGGYCGMKGEKDYQKALDNNSKKIEGDPDSFYGVTPVKRMLIAFAGPFFNFLFAFIAFTIIAMMGYSYYSAGTTVSMTPDVEQYKDIPSPAHDAGMMSGDKIVSIDGKQMSDFSDIITYISVHGDEDISIVAERDGKDMTFNVHSLLDKETGSGKLGIVSDANSVTEKQYPARSFFPALVEGGKQTGNMVALSVKSIGVLFKGVDITKTVSGPARITTMLGDTVKEGFKAGFHTGIISTLEFLALISISLFLMNLLPIPILDGGLILFSFLELILHRQISPKVLYYIQFIGIAFLGALLVLALIGDIQYFITKPKIQ
ncbi:MAG: site-2 protease family protein [Treponema sp.]